jgi:hypothetical protein
MLVMIDEDVNTAAIRAARAVGSATLLAADRLNAPLEDEAENWVTRIWDSTEVALRSAYQQGMAAARPWIDKVSALSQELLTSLGQRADKVWTVISARLSTYVQKAIDGALQHVRPTITVGGKELAMTTVTVEQKISLSGSLKASLQEVCEFVAEGEITLSAEYGAK